MNTDVYAIALKAEALADIGRYEDAREMSLRAIAAEPDREWGYVANAQACLGLRDFESAEESLRRALSISPSYAWCHRAMADCKRLQGQFAEAL
ncbi:MAG: hypothetical protein AAF394_13465, partial [Planctomycetota bacterium]